MTTSISCPHCSAKIRLQEEHLELEIRCPKCAERFHAGSAPRREPTRRGPRAARPERAGRKRNEADACPECGASLPKGAVLCTDCGYDLKRKTKLRPTFQAASRGKSKSERLEWAASPMPAKMAKVTWDDIIRTPFDIEFVFTETFVLTIWALFWGALYLAIGAALVTMSLSPLSIFFVSSGIAGALRYWIMVHDVSVKWLLALFGVMVLICMPIAYLLDAFPPPGFEESQARAGILFMGLMFELFMILLTLRMISLFFGKYFAILRRAALDTMFSDHDQGGLADLGAALVVLAVGLLPTFIVSVFMVIDAMRTGWDWPNIPIPFVILLIPTVLWAYFYSPMGVAAVALGKTVNPIEVQNWAIRAMPDYFKLLLVLFPLHLLAWATYALAMQLLLSGVDVGDPALAQAEFSIRSMFHLMLNPFFVIGIMLGAALLLMMNPYALLATIVACGLGEYTIVVTLVSLGRMMRRQESRIGWYAKAREH